MLVGGTALLGFYFIDTPVANAKQLVLRLFKTLTDLDYYKKMDFNSDRLLFLVDSQTKKCDF